MSSITNIILIYFVKFGYGGIIALMAIESSFVPFPSEIVIPPAAYLASKGELNIFLVVLAGIVGTMVGALINYFLALKLGKPIVYKLANSKYAKFFLISEYKLLRAEKYFLKYGKSSTFFGRLVPAVRQLISIPAGFSKMNLKSFILFTSLGSSIWIIILALLGYFIGENQYLLHKLFSQIKTITILAVIVSSILYFYLRKFKK